MVLTTKWKVQNGETCMLSSSWPPCSCLGYSKNGNITIQFDLSAAVPWLQREPGRAFKYIRGDERV